MVLILAWHHGERGRQRATGWELLAVAGVLLLAGVALATWAPGVQRSEIGRTHSGTVPALAVLPSDDRGSSGDESAYFAAGMHDDLLTRL